MRLTKEDALFLYGLLFHCAAGPGMGSAVDERVSEMLDALTEALLGVTDEEETSEDEEEEDEEAGDEDSDDVEDTDEEESDDDDEEEEEDTEEVEEPEAADHVCPAVLAGLASLSVVSPTGTKVTLEFEDVGEDTSIDALLDEGSVIIDGVTHLMLESDSKTVRLYDGNEWHLFGVKKLPKAWSKVLKPGIQYGLERVGDEEEEE